MNETENPPRRSGCRRGAAFVASLTLAALICAGPAGADGTAETPSPALPSALQAEIDGIQARYEKLVDFKARFVQESRLQAGSGGAAARGQVFFQKPGKMRWRYESPDPQDILIRDGKLWQYVPADGQVVIQGLDTSRVEYAFLTGLGELETQFKISWAEPRRRPGDPLVYMDLVPKDEEASFAEVVLGVDGKHRILVTEVTDFLGNVTILRFEKLEDNVGVAGEQFKWKNPPGADVIDMTEAFRAP